LIGADIVESAKNMFSLRFTQSSKLAIGMQLDYRHAIAAFAI
jgi:hypothetical protein